MTEPRVCRLCGSKETSLLHEQRELALNCITDGPALVETQIDYVICADCGTISQASVPSYEEVARYYGSIKIIDPGIRFAYKQNVQRDRAELVLGLTQIQHGRVIDIGAGDAAFLGFLKELSPNKLDLTGLEVSEEGTAMAQNDYGVPMINGTLESVDIDAEGMRSAYDLVTCMHTLEHVTEPGAFLDKLVSLVKPGGYLYLEIPSTERGWQIDNSVIGTIVHRGHISHFTGLGLSQELRKRGITVTEQRNSIDFCYPSLQLLGKNESLKDWGSQCFTALTDQIDAHFVEGAQTLREALSTTPKLALWAVGSDMYKVFQQAPDLINNEQIILIDGNPKKQGKTFMGRPVYGPEALDGVNAIMIATSNKSLTMDIEQDLQRLCPSVPLLKMFPNTATDNVAPRLAVSASLG